MKNCRNCKWAGWQRTADGKKRYMMFALCTYPTADIKLPASRWEEARSVRSPVGVAEYGPLSINCQTWEKEE